MLISHDAHHHLCSGLSVYAIVSKVSVGAAVTKAVANLGTKTITLADECNKIYANIGPSSSKSEKEETKNFGAKKRENYDLP